MSASRWPAVAFALLLCAAASVALPGAAMAAPVAPTGDPAATGPSPTGTLSNAHVDECAATPPDDHAPPDGGTSDVVGWVDGYWYNQSLDVEGEMTQAELENFTALTAARVEALRCLTFDELPPLETMTREEWRTEVEASFENGFTERDRLFTQAQLATLFYAGQAEDPEEVLIEHRTGFPAAFYDTEEDYMGFISDDPDRIEVDETTLAHELTHALQDQHFPVERVFEEQTNDEYMSSLATVEGDADLVGSQYDSNCGEWVDGCVRVEPAGSAEPSNWGLAIQDLAAYNSPLVAHTYERDGWDGVNQLLEEPPNSMVEALQPDRHARFEREPLVVLDRSNDEWIRVETSTGDHDIMGQHALTSMLLAPTFESAQDSQRVEVIDVNSFLQSHEGGDYDYNHSVTEGWQNDRFYAYANDAGQTGSVWAIAWEDESDAATFAAAYQELIRVRGGELVDESDNVYDVRSAPDYDMAVGIEQRNTRVWIVTAPTPDELEAVHSSYQADPDDDARLEQRVAELEQEIDRLESKLEERDERIDELESQQSDIEEFQERVDRLIEEGEFDNIEQILDRLEELERQENNASADDEPGSDETDDDDTPLPGFGPVLAAVAILLAAFGFRARRG